ncbi:MAG: hypothetical protein DI539_20375 [Flavobacterium psychrophilum]|nr:MAG: hypothetical protein DI539_20375 [Flavobacterium psychrophilum]
MKKILFVLAASAFVMSCKKLADNEYEITGTADASFNGKSLIIENQTPTGSYVPVDTVKIENGKFHTTGTVKEPDFRFISVFGGNPKDKINFVAEHGTINIEIAKDSLYKSKTTGTINNDLLAKYIELTRADKKKQENFVKNNSQAFQTASMNKDVTTMEKLDNEYKAIVNSRITKDLAFIKENPKAYINIFLISQMGGAKTLDEIKALYDKLDPELKKTEKGQDLGKRITEALAAQKGIPSIPAEAAAAPGKSNAEVGSTAPAFSANTPAGKKLSLKEAMGKVTIIDFWASWCVPCRNENPNVVALYNEYHAKGLNIIGVSLDKDSDKWKKAIADDKLNWNHVSNLLFWDEPIAKQYGVESIPATFILDASGKIVAKNLRGAELKAKVAELLK